MGMIRIEFPKDYELTSDFDFLGRVSAQVLADLVPGIEVMLKYMRATEEPNSPFLRITSPNWPPNILGGSFMHVPGHPEWYRQLILIMSDESKTFLEVDIPELKHARAISEDVSRAWAMHTDLQALPEIKAALAAQLPLWIVAHIAAEQYYSFGTYGSGKGLHDPMTQTVVSTLRYFESLASARVEHEKLSHGVVIASPSRKSKPLRFGKYPDDFLRLKRTPLLADGVRAALWISPSKEPIGWISAESLQKDRKRSSTVRNPFGSLNFLAEASKSLRGLALALRADGSIVIFARGRPLFVRRAGRWKGMLWKPVAKAIGRKYGNVGAMMFDAALILATTGYGGILGILESPPSGLDKKDRVDIARKEAFQNGVSVSIPFPEWLFHALLPTDKTLLLGAETVAMLAAIDGATVIDKKGNLLAYGAVVPSRPSGSEGARSAAARELSNKGFVIRVSADGPIALYTNGKQILEV